MIGYIEGTIVHIEERELIVLANGVGYTLFVSTETAANTKTGEKISLWTHLAVRENALDLYGMKTRDELALFRLLLGVSGIGPKSAMNILSLADVTTLTRAISSGDASYMTKVSGIGKRLAEKIILELKEKAALLTEEGGVTSPEIEAIEALEALGYSAKDTRELVRVIAKEHSTSEEIIRKALQKLGRQ